MLVVGQMHWWQLGLFSLAFWIAPLSAWPAPASDAVGTTTSTNAVGTDAALFFQLYQQAAELVARKQPQQAAILLQGLSKKLTGSPWIDITLLKHAELVEHTNPQAALEGYELLRQRVQNAPWFQNKTDRALLFGGALSGAIQAGINRMRTARLRAALDKYFARHAEYPESLAKLAILGYVEVADTLDASGEPFRYLPTGLQLAPFISYKRYEGLAFSPSEPLVVRNPRIDGITQEENGSHTVLLNLPGRADYQRVVENQTLEGYLVIAIAPDGVILTSRQRVLVLLPPQSPTP